MVSGYEIRVKLFNNFSIEIPETLPLINDILISNSYPLWFNSVDFVRVQNERIIFLAIFLSSHMQLLPASVQWNWWPTWWISYGLNSKIWTNNYECEKRAREVSADGVVVVWGEVWVLFMVQFIAFSTPPASWPCLRLVSRWGRKEFLMRIEMENTSSIECVDRKKGNTQWLMKRQIRIWLDSVDVLGFGEFLFGINPIMICVFFLNNWLKN